MECKPKTASKNIENPRKRYVLGEVHIKDIVNQDNVNLCNFEGYSAPQSLLYNFLTRSLVMIHSLVLSIK